MLRHAEQASIVIRPARESDHAALSSLWEQLDRLHGALHPDFFRYPARPRPRSDLRSLLGDAYRQIFVATHQRALVGVLQLQIYDTSHQPMMAPCRRGQVEDLVVDHRWRDRGVGRALMDRGIQWCEERAAKQVVLTVWSGNDDALEFYRHLGYREINRVLVLDLED